MIKQNNFDFLSDKKKLIYVNNLLNNFGIKNKLRRIGDVNMRIDSIGKIRNITALISIEFGNDMLSLPRKLLEGYAIMHNRYHIAKDKLLLIAVVKKLPNKRSDFYQVIDDILKILKIKIYTLPIDELTKFVKINKKVSDFDLENFFISRKIKNSLYKLAK